MLSFRPQTCWLRNMHLDPNKPLSPGSAKGFTMIELMISMVIMLIVTLATVQMSANVFRSNSEAIHMTHL